VTFIDKGPWIGTGSNTNALWSEPAAMAIPREGHFERKRGRYGPVYPHTPACYGFSIIAKVKEGREEAVRACGKQIEEAIAGSPDVLAPLRLHYLRWVLFDVGSGLHFQYQGIFDTDFDKYTEDAVKLFSQTGITTVFTNLEGFPEDWKENPKAFVKFVREHQCPSFLEYGEYPYVTADEIKKALRLKAAFSDMLDQVQPTTRTTSRASTKGAGESASTGRGATRGRPSGAPPRSKTASPPSPRSETSRGRVTRQKNTTPPTGSPKADSGRQKRSR
jgi:hypothetical protein